MSRFIEKNFIKIFGILTLAFFAFVYIKNAIERNKEAFGFLFREELEDFYY